MQLVYGHLGTILPAALIGAMIMASRKGDSRHKIFGKIYMVLVLISAAISLFMPAFVGPRFLNHFGWIHLLSILTILTVPAAYFAIKKGNIKLHRIYMIFVFTGGIIIAGTFALLPGRLLNDWLFT